MGPNRRSDLFLSLADMLAIREKSPKVEGKKYTRYGEPCGFRVRKC